MGKAQVKGVVERVQLAGVPGGLAGGLRAYQDQFRWFKSRRVHDRIVFPYIKKND